MHTGIFVRKTVNCPAFQFDSYRRVSNESEQDYAAVGVAVSEKLRALEGFDEMLLVEMTPV